MTIYYLIFVFVCLTGFLFCLNSRQIVFATNERCLYNAKKSQSSNLKILFAVYLIAIVLIIGLRKHTVGADTEAYIRDYYNVFLEKGTSRVANFEIVLKAIGYLCSLVSKEYNFFLIICSFLTTALFFNFILKNSKDPILSLVIFLGMFFIQSMNLMREWLAISFLVNAYTYYKEKKYKISIIFMLLAFFTHITSVAFLIIPFLFKIKNKKIMIFIVFAGCLLFYILRNTILSSIVSLVPKFYVYIYGSDMVNESAFNFKDIVFLFILSAFLFFLFLKPKMFSVREKENLYEYSVFLIIALTLSLVGQKYFMLHRIVYYFSVFLIISIPNFIKKMSFKNTISLAVVIAMFYMLYRNAVVDNNQISNYLFFWQ